MEAGARLAFAEAHGEVTLTVKTGGSTNVWTWRAVRDAKTPSVLTGMCDEKPLIGLAQDDQPP